MGTENDAVLEWFKENGYKPTSGNIVEYCELKEIAMGNKPRRYDGHGMRQLDEGEYVEYAVWLELQAENEVLTAEIDNLKRYIGEME